MKDIDDETLEDIDNPSIDNKKERKCLRCLQMFPSKNAGHRVCQRCKGQKAPEGGGIQVASILLPGKPK